MPKALVTGGNSKFGYAFVKELKKTHDVVVIPRRHLLSGQIYKYKGQYDIILFNTDRIKYKITIKGIAAN